MFEIAVDSTREDGSLYFVPVPHYHQTIKKDEFYVPLSIADLVLITGTNATSMEIVIAQEKAKKSLLVLFRFMGISNDMSEARQINPWNLGDVAVAIHHGLTMSDRFLMSAKVARFVFSWILHWASSFSASSLIPGASQKKFRSSRFLRYNRHSYRPLFPYHCCGQKHQLRDSEGPPGLA